MKCTVFVITSLCFCSFAQAVENFPWPLFLSSINKKNNSSGCFVVNDNGTVSDTCTSLMWQQNDTGNNVDIYDAVTYCDDLVLGEYSDWRLPQKEELKTLVLCSNGKSTPLRDPNIGKPDNHNEVMATCCGNYPYCNDYTSPVVNNAIQVSINTGDPKSLDYTYWTMWSAVGSDNTWLVNFNTGNTPYNYSTYNFRARCVRNVTDTNGIKVDCNGVVGGFAYLDECSICVGGDTGKIACTQDCNSEWGGTALVDGNGVCSETQPPLTPTCTSGEQTVMWKGREWQRCVDKNYFTLQGAKKYCESLNLGGYTDWQLPSKEELKSLVVCSNGHSVPLADYAFCDDDGYGNFTSPTLDPIFVYSDEYEAYWADGTVPDMVYGYGWYLRIYNGIMSPDEDSHYNKVRCIRP
ncbi:MAG: DUF1566 domain-containing protein [Candidatus Electrothrix sp. ATG2]|nr:DUF1566 domain-containing protein [Candidatus Electrothrix sp. ATG2]